jgi:hypothetical protein
MIISKQVQEGRDFDWFAVDDEGRIGHFTTAGFKYLPNSVSNSAEDLEHVTTYFKDIALKRGGYKVDSQLITEVPDWKDEEHEVQYLASFVGMAEKGLYSYDIHTYVAPGLAYFRVAIPVSPINVYELPTDVRKIVQRTKLQGIRFHSTPKIEYGATLHV